jgi:hypothetical protein
MGSSDSNMGAAGLFFLLMLCLGESSPSEFMDMYFAADASMLQKPK